MEKTIKKQLYPQSKNESLETHNEQWTHIITSKSKWFDINLKELWKYKDLIFILVKRDFVAVYKQTVLGPLWFFISPVLSTLVFTIVFGKIAKVQTGTTPSFLFYLSGLTCWNYFSHCLTHTANTFVGNAGLFSKVYFPRLVFPIATVISGVFTFIIQFILFIAFLIYFRSVGANIHLSLTITALPLLLLQMALLGLGLGILVSAVTIKYRDLSHLMGFGVQLWMYATPIVYPLSQVPEKYRYLFLLNPMASVIENFRSMFLGTPAPNMSITLCSILISSLVLLIGFGLFSRVEKTFMDTV